MQLFETTLLECIQYASEIKHPYLSILKGSQKNKTRASQRIGWERERDKSISLINQFMKRRHFINEVTRDTWLLFYHICSFFFISLLLLLLLQVRIQLLRYRFSIQSNCPKIIVCHFMPVIAIPIHIDCTSIYTDAISVGYACGMSTAAAPNRYILCNIWLFRYILFAHVECEMTVVIDYNSYFIYLSLFHLHTFPLPSLPLSSLAAVSLPLSLGKKNTVLSVLFKKKTKNTV